MPNSSALLSIQEAVYTTLSTDVTLLALTDAVLNYEPEEPPQKFIVIGSAMEQDWSTLGGIGSGWGWDTTVTVHCYSYYKGDLEVLQMLSRVTALLNQPAGFATISGYQTMIAEYGEKVTKVLIETKDKRERRHIPALFSIKVHE